MIPAKTKGRNSITVREKKRVDNRRQPSSPPNQTGNSGCVASMYVAFFRILKLKEIIEAITCRPLRERNIYLNNELFEKTGFILELLLLSTLLSCNTKL